VSIHALAVIVALGAVLGLDVVSFPQAMVSRPLVASTLTGAILGHAAGGLLIGVVLEMIALETLPVGAARYPEWGSASVVAGSILAANSDAAGAAFCVSVLAGLVTAWAGGLSMVTLRRLNGRMLRFGREAIDAGVPGTLVRLQLVGFGADVVRGGGITLIAVLLFSPLARWAAVRWAAGPTLSHAVVATLATSVAVAAVWQLFRSTKGATWLFVGGLAAGLVLVLVL
jgi:PTS system mannose-specific IIC component